MNVSFKNINPLRWKQRSIKYLKHRDDHEFLIQILVGEFRTERRGSRLQNFEFLSMRVATSYKREFVENLSSIIYWRLNGMFH